MEKDSLVLPEEREDFSWMLKQMCVSKGKKRGGMIEE